MAYVPLNSLWINLWKLWIAFDARVVAKAVLTGQLSRPGIVTGARFYCPVPQPGRFRGPASSPG
ncbi:hypothetical protein [Mycobacterium sp.]|uniref:hypothetical protein n=1 Tax=Mycobacterium sp. TaxID=1785 RepID=UPI003F972797